ncbi:hypothetical protein K438DRAFT_1844542 [Mycena galopus ATCC 62051]|nr:hypothetical protein K438DRAFT_1844542 [Mycena galopus ATCC 62051]
MSSNRVLTPTQFRVDTISDDSDAHAPKIQNSSRSLRQNVPTLDSLNLSPGEEDLTLCIALRSSDCDLTACASASSRFKMETRSLFPSSLDLVLSELPEIPDWYEDEPLKQESEPEPGHASATIPIPVLYTPTLNTPQSDYYSFEDCGDSSPGCEDLSPAGQCSDGATPASPELSSFKHQAKPPHTMPQHAPSQSYWCPQTLRRTYSFDLKNRRASEVPYMIPLDVGLGYGLGSPFSPPSISFPIDTDTDSDHLYTQSAGLQCTSPPLSLPLPMDENNLYFSPSPPGLRRLEALSAWRPQAPSPPPHPTSPSLLCSEDAHSPDQPFPSTASIWILQQQPVLRPPPSRPAPPPPPASVLSPSAFWPAARKPGEKLWTLEEQITIAVLQAMDSRDMLAAAEQQGSCSRLGGRSSNRKNKVSKLLGKIWRQVGVW